MVVEVPNGKQQPLASLISPIYGDDGGLTTLLDTTKGGLWPAIVLAGDKIEAAGIPF